MKLIRKVAIVAEKIVVMFVVVNNGSCLYFKKLVIGTLEEHEITWPKKQCSSVGKKHPQYEINWTKNRLQLKLQFIAD